MNELLEISLGLFFGGLFWLAYAYLVWYLEVIHEDRNNRQSKRGHSRSA